MSDTIVPVVCETVSGIWRTCAVCGFVSFVDPDEHVPTLCAYLHPGTVGVPEQVEQTEQAGQGVAA